MISPIKRTYENLAGVDFSNDPSKVLLNRSPDCVNMYRDYTSTQGKCIETRLGYTKLATIGTKTNGIYFFEFNNTVEVIVHSGVKLYKWTNYPTTPAIAVELYSDMNDRKSSFFVFGKKLYINDGLHYLVYDGTTVESTSANSFIPTTSIARKPTGGGTFYQPINLLQSSRKNSFLADGTSTVYYLDAMSITSIISVTVNGTSVSTYTTDLTLGKITFATAPIVPLTSGQDNVIVTFSKVVSSYASRISNCTKTIVFDRRVFFTGNLEFPNAIFHCELENPSYISDLAYYQDGLDTVSIKSMTIGNNLLWIFKESNQQSPTVFYHTPTLDYEYGKIYPSKQGNISLGCYSNSINFNDDIVFMSKQGLEGISGDINSEQLLSHRSSLVDNKMINENNFNECELQEWNGYLLCLVNGKIFLADSRQKYQGQNSFEYEWYYWNNIQDNGYIATIIKEYKGLLYFGCENGSICEFTGTNDNGGILYSQWVIPNDNFGIENKYKTTNKRGGIAKIKTIPNGQCKVAEITNKGQLKEIGKWSSTGFDYSNFDYANFAYSTSVDSRFIYKIKEKKFIDIALKFYSDELDKPFGLYSAVLEAYVSGYVKGG